MTSSMLHGWNESGLEGTNHELHTLPRFQWGGHVVLKPPPFGGEERLVRRVEVVVCGTKWED